MRIEQVILYLLGPAAGYLLGSIPFGFVIGLANGVDIRKVGSGNIGATNLGRALGRRFFFYAFLLDAAKGLLPVLAISLLAQSWRAGSLEVPLWAPLLTGGGALAGHLFPLYLRFKGGKGVATGFGVVLGLWPVYTVAGLGAGAIFVLVVLGWRYISLASIVGALVFPLLVLYVGSSGKICPPMEWRDLTPLLVVAGAFALLIAWKHRGNISRLRAGTEPKVGERKRAADNPVQK